MTDVQFLKTRIRVEKTENREIYFIPEVLVFYSFLDWSDREFLSRSRRGRYSQEFENFLKIYLELYGKSVEWCVIKKSRSYYKSGYVPYNRSPFDKKIGLKTLKGAKGAIDDFKEKYKNSF